MEPVKGFQDFVGEPALVREAIRSILVKNFSLYGFEAAETPVIEQEEFVKGSNENDEAVSDIFKLQDKGERKLALRYEFTFQLKRIAGNRKLPFKRYQIGYVFRDEPTSSNRFRQFTQCDIDIVGSSVKEEAEILALTSKILKELKIDAEIQFNNRKLLNAIIKSLLITNTEFVLRQIDKLDKQGEDYVKGELAKFIDKATILNLFKILNSKKEMKKFPEYKEISSLIEACKNYDINLVFNPFIVRGLSYYNGSVFEIKTSKSKDFDGAQKSRISDTKEMKETICAGGSYPINSIQSTGISFGLERLSQLAKVKLNDKKTLIININEDKKSIELAEKLRKQGTPVIISEKISKGLEYANSYNIPKVIFVGSEEVKKKKFKIRDMKSGKEEFLSEKEILERLR